MKNNQNLNLFEYLIFLKKRKKKIFLHSTIIFLFLFIILLINFSKINNYKYEQHIRITPISYINFSKQFLYAEIETKIIDEKSERDLSLADDSFLRQGLTPLTIFYHYISVLDSIFNDSFYLNEEKKSNFGFFENKWNSSGLLHEFNINVYDNDFNNLDKKVKKIFNNTNEIVLADIINYLEKYSKQKNINNSQLNKVNETIKILQAENKVIRLYISQKTKIINNSHLLMMLALFFSILFAILIQTLSSNFNLNK